MKIRIGKTILLVLFLALIFFLNKSVGSIPPIGKLLSPFTGFTQNGKLLVLEKSLHLKKIDLLDSAQVQYDTFGIPHIFAKNEHDMYFLQGYIHARDRLWQLDMQGRSGMGELAEVVGDKALENDRLMRRLRIPASAENQIRSLENQPIYEVLKNYVSGVNEYIDRLPTKNIPIEYKLMGFEPREYKEVYVSALLKVMALRLSAMEADVENTNFVNKFGMKDFEMLFPNFYEFQSPIIPKGTAFTYSHEKQKLDPKNISKNTYPDKVLKHQERLLGSNNWAIHKSKSKSGHAILCNDPHLKIHLPAIWYEMQLVSDSLNMYGASMPGAPCIIIGFNSNISWGVTNAGRDVRNWYDMKFVDETKKEIIVDDNKEKTQQIVEKIKVKNGDDFYDTITLTSFGPIVYDESYRTSENENYQNLALGWTSFLESNEVMTFYKLNRARNVHEYQTALNTFFCPGQNFVYADIEGNVAIKQQGLFPDVPQGKDKFVLDGSKSENKLNKFIPVENNPYILNPKRGYVSSANQHPTDEKYPYYYSSSDFEAYRNRRINSLLESKPKFSIKDMKEIQCDNFSLLASEFLPIFLNHAIPENKHIQLLSNWDFNYSHNSKAATLFDIWYNHFQYMVWDELQVANVSLDYPQEIVLYSLALHDEKNKYFDILSTPKKETMLDIIEMSFMKAVGDYEALDEKEWGKYQEVDIAHLTGIPSLGKYQVNTGGNVHIINATHKSWAPSWRMIVEMNPEQPSGFVIFPGGNSGLPGHKHYSDFISKWARYQYRPIKLNKTPSEIQSEISLYFDKK